MTYEWGIYQQKNGRYVVRKFDDAIPGLWCPLGPWYTRERAQKLADALTLEWEEEHGRRKRQANPQSRPDSDPGLATDGSHPAPAGP